MSEIQRGSQIIPGNQLASYATEDNNREDAIHYLMWSGGCDSTLLLYELLERYGCERVVCVSYKYPWLLDSKYQTEKLHREAFKAKMKLRGDKFANIRHTEFTINQDTITGPMLNTHCGGLPQAVGWLLSIPVYVVSGSYVYDGGIRCDDLTLVLEDYHKLFKSVSNVLSRNLILRQPYLYLEKYQIVEKLFQYDIYEETWFCEIPQAIGVHCGECTPCKTHIAALNVLANTTNDDFIRLRANKELEKIKELLAKNKDIKKGDDVKLCKED